MPIMIPASLKIATLFPCWAMRVKRPALPLSDAPRDVKPSFCIQRSDASPSSVLRSPTYGVVYELVISCAVVDVDGHASQSRDLRRKLIEELIILAVARSQPLAMQGRCSFSYLSRAYASVIVKR